MKTLRPICIHHSLIRTQTATLPPAHACRAAYISRYTNHNRPHHQAQRRTFLANPFANNDPQSISASRTLPYPTPQIFSIITDVSSYHHYYPFCKESTVTKYSQPVPTSDGKRYPEEAKLVVGWDSGGVREEFWSRVYCVPDRIVEAVSGDAETSLPSDSIAHHNARPSSSSTGEAGEEEDKTRRSDVLSFLRTRWTLRPLRQGKGMGMGEGEGTEVNLKIEFQFANPLYSALSQAAVPRVAEKLVEAFERRVEEVVNGRTNGSGSNSSSNGENRK